MRILPALLLAGAVAAADAPDPTKSVVGIAARRTIQFRGRTVPMGVSQVGVVIGKDTVLTLSLGDSPENLRVFLPGTSDPLDAEVIAGDDAWSVLKVEDLDAPALTFKADWSPRPGQGVRWIALLAGQARWTPVAKEALVDAVIEDAATGKSVAYSDPPFRGPVASAGALVVDAENRPVGLVAMMERTQQAGGGGRGMMRRGGGGIPVVRSAASFAHYLHGEIRRRGVLGITGEPLAEKVAAALGMTGTVGVLVTQVTPGSGADAAGVKPEDVIVRVDGAATPGLAKLQQRLSGKKAGDAVEVEIVRLTDKGPAPSTMTVTLTAREDPDKEDRYRARRFGFVAEPLTATTRASHGVGEDVRGVHVRRVTAGTPAALARPTPLRRGDIVLRVGDLDVPTVEDLKKALQRLPNGASVTLFVRNQQDTRFVEITPEDE